MCVQIAWSGRLHKDESESYTNMKSETAMSKFEAASAVDVLNVPTLPYLSFT